ncbi:MAG: VOC family protein [Gammaproteobacteria bacterium]|nr:VOC family protein [Gammaproteobacteria bacterium]
MTITQPPPGYPTVSTYMVAIEIDPVIDFYTRVLGARVGEKLIDHDGHTRHTELRIGDSMIMIGRSPGEGLPPVPQTLYIYVDDVDAVQQAAIEAGATEIIAPADMFYGDRQGGVTDPFGNTLWLATRIENLAPGELQRRAQEFWQNN